MCRTTVAFCAGGKDIRGQLVCRYRSSLRTPVCCNLYCTLGHILICLCRLPDHQPSNFHHFPVDQTYVRSISYTSFHQNASSRSLISLTTRPRYPAASRDRVVELIKPELTNPFLPLRHSFIDLCMQQQQRHRHHNNFNASLISCNSIPSYAPFWRIS